MGAIIHMDTEEVTHVIYQIRQIQQAMNDQVDLMAARVSNMDWSGRNRDHFVHNFQSWKQVACSRLADLQNLAGILAVEQDQWMQADSNGVNHLKSMLVDASVGSAISGVLWWLTDNAWKTKQQQYSIDDAWQQMISTDSGKELIELAKKLGFKFILPSGETIGDGEYVVNISVEDLEDGIAGQAGEGQIVFDQEVMDKTYKSPDYLSQVLAHEIQHQLDRKQGLLPGDDHADIILGNLGNGDYDSAEKILKESIQKRAESEVRAFNRGFEVDRGYQIGEEETFNNDGIASPQEIRHVIENRDYENIYEEQYNRAFPGYRVDVWVDDAGQIQCDIVKLIEAKNVYYA